MATIALIYKSVMDNEGLRKGIAESQGFLDGVASKAKSVGNAMLPVTAAITGIGVAAIAAHEVIDDAMDSIRATTGATDSALDGLRESFDTVFKTVPVSAGDAAKAIGELNARTGATGPGLERLSTQVLNLSRVTKTDLSANIAASSRLFGDWSIASDKQAGSLDHVFKVSQQTGIGVTSLMEKVVAFGAPLRQFNFSFEESTALMGKWEKEGVNSELILGSLRVGMAKFAAEGIPLRQGLDATIAKIQALGPGAEATSLAMKTFGRRAGPDMAAAILEGRFEIEKLLKTIDGSPETISKAAAATDGWREKLILLKNQATLALEPLGARLVDALERVMPALFSVLGLVERLATGFSHLPEPVQTTLIVLAALVAAGAPLLIMLSSLITSVTALAPLLGLAGLGGGLAALAGVLAVGGPLAAALLFTITKINKMEADFKTTAEASGLLKKAILDVKEAEDILRAAEAGRRGEQLAGQRVTLDMAAAWKTGKDAADQAARATATAAADSTQFAAAMSGATVTLKGFGAVAGTETPVAVGKASESVKQFTSHVNTLRERIAGTDVKEAAMVWAAALRTPQMVAKTLADESLRQDLIAALDAVVAKFGSLKAAGLGALESVRTQAKAADDAWRDVPTILGLTIRQFERLRDMPKVQLQGYNPATDPGNVPLFFAGGLSFNQIKKFADDAKYVKVNQVYDPAKDPGNVPLFFAGGLTWNQLQKFVEDARLIEPPKIEPPKIDWAKRREQFKAEIESVGLDVAHGLATAIADGIETGDWSQFENNLKAVLAQGMGSAAAAAVNMVLPGLGTALQPLFAALSDKLLGILGLGTKGRDIVKDFVASFGGFDALHRQLNALPTGVGEKLWIQLTQGVGRNNPQQAKAAIDAITAALNKQNAEIEKQAARFRNATAVMEEYGFTFADAGDKFRAAKLGEELDALYEKTLTLKEAGIDYDEILRRQAKQYSEIYQKAISTNTEIDASMRPILQRLVDMGLLLDASGVAFEDLDDASWAKTLTQGFDQVTAAIYDLRDALVGGVGGAIDEINRRVIRPKIILDMPEIPDVGGSSPAPAATGGLVTSATILPFSRGGAVPKVNYFDGGGEVGRMLPFVPKGTDTVPAMLTPGEPVLDERAAGSLGSCIQSERIAA